MATLQITQVGYNAVLDAQANGYTLAVTTVKFGDGTNYVPSLGDTALHGKVLWSGPIANCDVITGEVIDFLCICPESLDPTGSGTVILIGEIGLYLATGELFAIGCYEPPQPKLPNARFKTHALVLAPYLSASIDLTLNWTVSLPRVNFYGQLPNPQRTGDNCYIVNHGFTASGFIRPSMLTRYATDSQTLAWGLLNGNLYYSGPVTVSSANSFSLVNPPITNVPPAVIDFAFVYVYAGTGATQCRAVSYNSSTGMFETLYEDFSLEVTLNNNAQANACDVLNNTGAVQALTVTNLDQTSQIMIWTAVRLDEGTGLVYQGRWDASTGYPATPLRGQYWVISAVGILNGVCYQAGDWLVYSGNGIWDKIDNTELPYLLYRGQWDASTGQAPPSQPVTYYWENLRQGHYWVIHVAGIIANTHYEVGDWIVWNGSAWDRVANTLGMSFKGYFAVTSTNLKPTTADTMNFWIISSSGIIDSVYYDVGDWLICVNGTTFTKINNQQSVTFKGMYNPNLSSKYPTINNEGDWYIISNNAQVINQFDLSVKDNLMVDDWIIATGDKWRILTNSALNYNGKYDASVGVVPTASHKGDYWVISQSGILAGDYYDVNDWITWNGTGWNKISNREGIKYKGTFSILATDVAPTPTTLGDYWLIKQAGTVGGNYYDVDDWLVWGVSKWEKVSNREGLKNRGNFAIDVADVGPPDAHISGDYWIVTKSGIINGVTYNVGDWIIWNGAGWYKNSNSTVVKAGTDISVYNNTDGSITINNVARSSKLCFWEKSFTMCRDYGTIADMQANKVSLDFSNWPAAYDNIMGNTPGTTATGDFLIIPFVIRMWDTHKTPNDNHPTGLGNYWININDREVFKVDHDPTSLLLTITAVDMRLYYGHTSTDNIAYQQNPGYPVGVRVVVIGGTSSTLATMNIDPSITGITVPDTYTLTPSG